MSKMLQLAESLAARATLVDPREVLGSLNYLAEMAITEVDKGEKPSDVIEEWIWSNEASSILETQFNPYVMEEVYDNRSIIVPALVDKANNVLNFVDDNQVKYKDFIEHFGDWRWRIQNLYYVVNMDSIIEVYKPKPAQWFLYNGLHTRNIVLKSRRQGGTTAISILFLDQVIFNENKKAVIIAHGLNEVRYLFKTRIMFPFKRMPDFVLDSLQVDKNNANELSFSNDGMIRVTVSTRSGEADFLLVSELGIMCHKYPAKADEVITGAIQSIPQNAVVVIESTAYGRNKFETLSIEARDLNDEYRAKKQPLPKLAYSFKFLPWFRDPSNTVIPAQGFYYSQEEIDYLTYVQESNHYKLDEGKCQWYAMTSRNLGKELMKREYPSTPEEAFETSTDGLFFNSQMVTAREQGRITDVNYDPKYPYYVSWDLGINDLMVLTFFQIIKKEKRVFHVYADHNKGLEDYIVYIQNTFGLKRDTSLIFPHDMKVRELTLKTGLNRLKWLLNSKFIIDGYENPVKLTALPVYRIPVTESKASDIDLTRADLRYWFFDEKNAEDLIEALQRYAKKFDPINQIFTSEPIHNRYAHFADSFMAAVRFTRIIFPSNDRIEEDLDKVMR